MSAVEGATQAVEQHYTYTFVVKHKMLTGTDKNDMGETQTSDGQG